jgi:BirA family biotin operon repressor/biotin-[acetyl-CoA-carboxylase] ligase
LPGDGFEQLARALSAGRRRIGLDTVAVRSIDSTNRLARRLAERLGDELPDLLVVAWSQTAGRGRVGRSWSSPAGLGAYQSLVWHPHDRRSLALTPLRVGVALCTVLRELAPEVALKWPNDLVTARGKLGGILIERLGQRDEGILIVGYGINVAHAESELPLPSATSLRLETGAVPPLGDLVARMAIAVRAELESDEAPDRTLERYRELTVHRLGDRLGCTLADQRYEGRFGGFDDQGRLLLETAAGRRVLSAADAVESTAGA